MRGLFVPLPEPAITRDYIGQLIDHISTDHPEMREITFWGADLRLLAEKVVGQDLSHFESVFVGAQEVPWFGARPDTPKNLQPWMRGISGVEGMQTASYRWDQIAADENLAKAHEWNWYITIEVGLDAIGDHPSLRSAWEAYLVETCRRLYSIRRTGKVLWSPYVWDGYDKMDTARRLRIRAALGTMTRNIRLYSQSPSISYIDIQDGQGQQPLEPPFEGIAWHKLLANSNAGGGVRINMELFSRNLNYADNFGALEKVVIRGREETYKINGVPVGNCWAAWHWLIPYYVNHLQ